MLRGVVDVLRLAELLCHRTRASLLFLACRVVHFQEDNKTKQKQNEPDGRSLICLEPHYLKLLTIVSRGLRQIRRNPFVATPVNRVSE